MNDINEMPPKCQYCPYWEVCEYPWVCPDMWQQDEEPIQQTCYATDTISRQAAIDAVSDCGICIQRIVDLPYTQPEQRWIPCGERLPEKNCRCLTTNTALGAFEVDFNVWINGEWLYPNKKPIAWMPLPEPYKENDHD